MGQCAETDEGDLCPAGKNVRQAYEPLGVPAGRILEMIGRGRFDETMSGVEDAGDRAPSKVGELDDPFWRRSGHMRASSLTTSAVISD